MSERLLKDEYETPRICVRGVFLCEEVAASYAPIIPYGSVWYSPYEEDTTPYYAGDVMVF
jgi:hypothetical protein